MLGLLLTALVLLTPQDELDARLEAATKAALAKIAPCVVQVRTVGGAEFLGRREAAVQRGTGPTTGLIVTADGYIISSSFNFANKPAAITVAIPGHKEPLPARVIAEDKTRMLTLLKVEATALPVPTPTPRARLKIGQWTIAVGRTWGESQNTTPSASVGILSALDRVWGKAVQTDAKVSPVNYGGPLIDLEGRVIGVLVPLSPRGDSETAGVEWYDSGIGFAIPIEDILHVLPRLKVGKTLQKGRIGVTMKQEDPVMTPSEITSVTLDSPASKLPLQPGDRVIAVDDKPVHNQAQFLHAMGPKYEGDSISLKIKRGDKELSFDKVVLTGQPANHNPAFLGILPVRDDNENGVQVRYVFPESPAARAGIVAGDRILRVDNVPLKDRESLRFLIDRFMPGMKAKLDVKQKGGSKKVDVTLAAMTDALPPSELPSGTAKKAMAERKPLSGMPPVPGKSPGKAPAKVPAKAPNKSPTKDNAPPAEKAKTGFFEVNDPASGNSTWYYVPEDYDPNISYGVVVWLHPSGEPMQQAILNLWKPICKQYQLILMGPKAEHPNGWLTSEADVVQTQLRVLLHQYTIDRGRIVLHGLGNGADFALYLGFDAREQVRGVAAVAGALPQPPKENLPGRPLSFFLVAGDRDPRIEAIRAVPAKLKAQHYPTLYHETPNQGSGYIADPIVLEQLILWIVGLDRI